MSTQQHFFEYYYFGIWIVCLKKVDFQLLRVIGQCVLCSSHAETLYHRQTSQQSVNGEDLVASDPPSLKCRKEVQKVYLAGLLLGKVLGAVGNNGTNHHMKIFTECSLIY